MHLPIDKYRCIICSDRTPVRMACEACWGGVHEDCSVIIWVVRNNEDAAHVLCKDCGNEDY